VDNPPDIGQPDARPLELGIAVQALKHPKEFVCVLHIKSHSIIAHKEYNLPLSFAAADFNLSSVGRPRVLDSIRQQILPD
jgi:hypothetical protein